jgi:hypothetical protein
MHYDCILHALRGYEAYIYAEEHRYFECPRCRCEYNQEEQWYMDRKLSLYMPAEYECRIWDSFEGIRREITRHNFKPPDEDKWSEVGPSWWADSSRPPEIFMRALHPLNYHWSARWGNKFGIGPNEEYSWELWPRGPVRTVTLDIDEYVGADVILATETVSSTQTKLEPIDKCHRCTRAATMEGIWNQFKEPADHVSITHCIVCDRIILKLPRTAYKEHHPPDHCRAHYHEDNGKESPQHHRHDRMRFEDKTTCQPLPHNKPT